MLVPDNPAKTGIVRVVDQDDAMLFTPVQHLAAGLYA
jgi:hypothetical protein